MAKVTAKLQVTLPKALAEKYRIAPGSEIEWQAAGDVIRVIPPSGTRAPLDVRERLQIFDAATERQRRREKGARRRGRRAAGRGWTRESLYGRGRAR